MEPGTPPPPPEPYPPGLPPPEEAEVHVVECDLAAPALEPGTPVPARFRVHIGRVPRRALAVVAAAVMLVAGLVAWWSWPRPAPIEPVGPTAIEAPTPSAQAQAAPLVVSVAGKVRRPGLVRVPAGSRVVDAIEAAGGLTEPDAAGYLNLARRLVDGELIVVGAPEAPAGANPAAGAPVNLNAATVTDLDALPGVGPVLAQRIVDYRDAHGGFGSVEQLRQVEGIGAAKYDDLKGLVTV